MDPLTLLGLAAAAGFVFRNASGSSSQNKRQSQELNYSANTVAPPARRSPTEFDTESIEVLLEYEVVRELVHHQFPLIFVTGGAGTGKSTFINWLMDQYDGKALLGTPTGMAAVNVGGKTLHSLCQLPPAWITQKDIKTTPRRREIQQAKVLIIDEISMVTANLLDGVSAFLRLNRGIDKPFGGLPVVMVGDMFQLPPVVTGDTRDLFDKYYGSPKFYNARCLQETTYYAVELRKTYRQEDQTFVDQLVRIREGIDLGNVLNTLNSTAAIRPEPPQSAVWLSPRNAEVDARNQAELEKLQGTARTYSGTIAGSFKKDRLPSPMTLTLKVDAQVMFTKNDPDGRWVNGTVGHVCELHDDHIVVAIADSGKLVNAARAKWPDYRYQWNAETNEIERIEIGYYVQFPIILGWSITIHKSQGRTIERVHLDLGSGAFDTGQTYVALSRCRSASGLTMTRPLFHSDIMVDGESKAFYDQLRRVIQELPPEAMADRLGLNSSSSSSTQQT